jgi:uncharacterized protein (DUF302 family)
MKIDYSRETSLNVKKAVEKLTADLKSSGWGVLGVIDVKKIFSEKLNLEYDEYIILDVCNPVLASKGLRINKQAGLILPCKIIVYDDNGKTKVSLYKPTVALSTAVSLQGYDELANLAHEAEKGLKEIVDKQ